MEVLSPYSKLNSRKVTMSSTTQNQKNNLMAQAKLSFCRTNSLITISALNPRTSSSTMTWKLNFSTWTLSPRKKRKPSISGLTPLSLISQASCLSTSPWLRRRRRIRSARSLTRISGSRCMPVRYTSIKCKKLKWAGQRSWCRLKSSLRMKLDCLK